jgi:hypothetical protein
MKRGPPERLSGQIIPDNLMPGFGLTTHITHHFRRPLFTTLEAKYAHNFKRRLKQRT